MITENVYIVTDGDYSDYSILAVFTSIERAEQYCVYHKLLSKYNDPKIEVWPLDMDLSRAERGETLYRFYGMKDRCMASPMHVIEPEFVDWFGADDNKYLHGYMWADSEERVVKVVAEKVAQILAMGLWGESEALEMFNG